MSTVGNPLAKNIPNMITLARVLSVPLLVWLVLDGYIVAAFWVFIAAGISDALDGFVAKHFEAESEFGKFFDPLADKAVLVSIYITLGFLGLLVSWIVILVVFRDIFIISGVLLFKILSLPLSPKPLPVSKLNTLAQIILAATVLGVNAYQVDDAGLVAIMTYVVMATTVLSGAAYAITWGRRADCLGEAGEHR